MNLKRVACWFGRHDLTVWRKASVDVDGASIQERHCKRRGCGYLETRKARERKPAAPRQPNLFMTGHLLSESGALGLPRTPQEADARAQEERKP